MRALDFVIALIAFTVGYSAKQGTYLPIAIMLSLCVIQAFTIINIQKYAEFRRKESTPQTKKKRSE